MSTATFSDSEMRLLELGLNFGIPFKHHNELLIEASINVEKALQQHDWNQYMISDAHLEKVRFGVAKILKSKQNKPDVTVEQYQWIKKDVMALAKRKDIVICPADKGNATIILDRSKYEMEINNLLQDKAYSKNPLETTQSIEKYIQEKCKNLMNQKRITKDDYKYLTPSDTRCPRFYALPKIHKEDMPFRPIVDFRYSAAYNLAQFLGNILKILGNSHPTTLKNSYFFARDIKDMHEISEGHVMVSYDVISLFTNVPIEYTLDIINAKLHETSEWKTKAPSLLPEDVMSLIIICVNCTIFSWKNEPYKQVNGLPMGSPISPPFAEIFMQRLEETQISNNNSIYFWRRLVDDAFAIIPDTSEDTLLGNLNTFHSSISFTIEKEEHGQLPFLDVFVMRTTTGLIEKTVYRKSTHTGRYLNFQSYHHMSHKISVIDSLAFRAYVICDDKYLSVELDLISEQLVTNGYPKKMIIKRFARIEIRAAQWNPNNRISEEDNQLDKKPRLILPYMGPLTNELTQFLRFMLDCEFGYIPGKKIGSFLCSLKDTIPRTEIGCIYKIPIRHRITNILVKWYIGETSKALRIRINQHRKDVLKSRDTSAIVQHIRKFPEHYADFDSASLIENEPRYFHRKFKEHLYIISNNTINLNRGFSVSSIWDGSLTHFLPQLQDI